MEGVTIQANNSRDTLRVMKLSCYRLRWWLHKSTRVIKLHRINYTHTQFEDEIILNLDFTLYVFKNTKVISL